MSKKARAKKEVMDERQIKERYRFGFHSFMLTCIELVIILVSSMLFYDKINSGISFYTILMCALIIPLLYFNIATKVNGVTNNFECILSIILGVLYIISLIISAIHGQFTVINLIVGIFFVVNGLMGLLFMVSDKKARERDYREVHGGAESRGAESRGAEPRDGEPRDGEPRDGEPRGAEPRGASKDAVDAKDNPTKISGNFTGTKM